MQRAGVLAAALVLFLAPGAALAEKVSEKELIARTTLDSAELARREAAIAAMTPEQQGESMTALVNDRTIIYYQQGHGVYVEYTAADGRLFMWYPRNGGVVRGTWGLRAMSGPKLCYQYRNSVHGVTGEYEPNECIPPEQKLVGASVLDSRSGDPFGLAQGTIPYPKSPRDVPDWPTSAEQN
jgi:hypothetical protein